MSEEESFAAKVISLLCAYAGDAKVFEAFLEHWGAEAVAEVLNDILQPEEVCEEEDGLFGDISGLVVDD